MRKKGHLSLVETSTAKSNQQETDGFPLVTPNLDRAKLTVAQRLRDADIELASIRQITDATLSLLRTLPAGLLKTHELNDLAQTFLKSQSLLDLYQTELTHLANSRLSILEIRQFTRARNNLKRLRASLPEAAAAFFEAVRKTAKQVAPAGQDRTAMPPAPNGIQLKVTLKGSRPPIWRRLLVPGDCTLAELHFLIQRSMGWSDHYLHCFHIGGKAYCEQRGGCDEDELTLEEFNLAQGSRFEYKYGSADGWVHQVMFERTLESPHHVLECVEGRRACPPESGGLQGLPTL
jgi:hypothetical protein